jgi:hypothetical protein
MCMHYIDKRDDIVTAYPVCGQEMALWVTKEREKVTCGSCIRVMHSKRGRS